VTQETTWPEANSVLIIVDFSAVAYACWATAENAQQAGQEALQEHLSRGCAFCTTAPGGALVTACAEAPKQYDAHEVLKTNLRMKMSTIEEHTGEPANKYVMVLDDHPKWKYDLFPEYKGEREVRFNPRPEAEAYLREAYPGAQWVRSPGNEADDAIAALVKANKAQRAIVIVSGDKDLWQLLEPRVKIFNSLTKKFLDLEKVAEKFYGLEPHHIRAAKAFWGDSSDSLPNCAPRQQKQLVPLIREAAGNLGAMQGLQSKVSKACWDHLVKNAQQIATNWQLAGLNLDAPLEWR
jgi:5'-3' exonuclease